MILTGVLYFIERCGTAFNNDTAQNDVAFEATAGELGHPKDWVEVSFLTLVREPGRG